MAQHGAMSMEAMLDQERREVLALLEGNSGSRPRPPSSIGGRSPSPYTSPRSPAPVVRSMLDVDTPPPAAVPVRSMLDVDSPPPSASLKPVFSNPTSPTASSFNAHSANSGLHPRSLSDATAKPVDFGPRASTSLLPDPTKDYQFSDIITNNIGQSLPKRVGQKGRLSSGTSYTSSSMAEVMRGHDVSGLVLPGDRGRGHYSGAGPSMKLSNKSKSPHNRLGLRSSSPRNVLSGRNLSPAGKAFLEDSESINFQNAYRRLSDAAIARSGGSLSELMMRRKRSDESAGTGRLEKDYLGPDGEILNEESSEDDQASSSDEGERGRKAARSFDESEQGPKSPSSVSPETQRKTLSLLAAAEEERAQVAAEQPVYTYRSLLDDPEITVTNPSGKQEKVKNSKPGVHPATSFDLDTGSGSRTPMDSDDEADLTDIKRAQNLSFRMTRVLDSADSPRSKQILERGDWAKIAQDPDKDHECRKFLVATDLSEESKYALEWAIGTVLRDGDTLIAIYCVDEETGIGGAENETAGEDTLKASKSGGTPASSTMSLALHRASPLAHTSETHSTTSSPAPSKRDQNRAERHRAVQEITDRLTNLLRKTRLQVRAMAEVIHCKNPKHLILEVIDIIEPNLVILGSRGRSALKGVILGSFSNYLVTKSSVPVMVARKRLRKQKKGKTPAQINNITSSMARTLANAKID